MTVEAPPLPPGMDLRVLGGKSPAWAEGFREGWEERGDRPASTTSKTEFGPRGKFAVRVEVIDARRGAGETPSGPFARKASIIDEVDYLMGYKEGWMSREKYDDDG